MAERELSDEEAKALGLPVGPTGPSERELAPEEAQQLGLEAKPPPSLGRSLAVKFAEGGTKGWLDELGGLIAKATTPELVYPKGHQGPRPTVYEVTRDAIRREEQDIAKARPKLAFGASLAGDVTSDYLLSKAGAPVTSLPGQMALGAVSGTGYADKDTPGGTGGGAAIGAGSSLVGYGLGRYVAPRVLNAVSQPVKRALQDFAAKRAVKATGAIQSNIKGIPKEKLLETGRVLLDQGVIRPFQSAAGVQETADEALKRLGPAVGETLKRADALAAQKAGPAFDWDTVLDRVQKEVIDDLGVEGRSLAQKPAQTVLDTAAEGGGYSAANKLKHELQEGISYNADPKLKQRVARAIASIVRDEEEKQVERALGDQVGQEFLDAKKLYQAMARASEWSKKGSERMTGNRFLSPSDMGMGAAQMAGQVAQGRSELEAIPKAAALALVHKLLRERGASTTAVAANALAKANLPRKLAEAQSRPALSAGEMALLRQWLARQGGGEGER